MSHTEMISSLFTKRDTVHPGQGAEGVETRVLERTLYDKKSLGTN